MEQTNDYPLSAADLLELMRWNTPTIYNGWEQVTESDAGKDGFNAEECRDFMPQMPAMVGYAVTVVIEPSNAEHRRKNPKAWSEMRCVVLDIRQLLAGCVSVMHTFIRFDGIARSRYSGEPSGRGN